MHPRDADPLDDHRLAGLMAARAGRHLQAVRAAAFESSDSTWEIRDEGDRVAHDLLMAMLEQHRPADAVLSEEGVEDPLARRSNRLWVIDPLDGTVDYSQPGNPNWAVHVALCVDGRVGPSAVAVPDRQCVFTTAMCPLADDAPSRVRRTEPVVISNRSTAGLGEMLADAHDGQLLVRGSAGVKAMAVVNGEADIYVHGTGLYDWDAAAPAGVAAAAGLHVSDLFGAPLRFDEPRPVVPGLVICREQWSASVLDMLSR